jgi:predicted MFS family arabinose efflux permease
MNPHSPSKSDPSVAVDAVAHCLRTNGGAAAAAEGSHYSLGRRASFWVSTGVVSHTFWTSAAPAMAYPLFAAEWHLSHATITGIFAIYPITVVATLVGFGDISDHIGRRVVLLAGLAASLAGVAIFALAPSAIWLFVGRAFMGLGVGLTAGPSTAAVVEFSRPDRIKSAASITAAAQAAGFVAALLLGGALVQYAPFPMRTSFWLLFFVITSLLAATWFLPNQPAGDEGGRWQPGLPAIPPTMRRTFAVASAAVTTAYTHGVLILSLGAQVARDLVGSENAFVNGGALSLFAVFSGIVGIAARSLHFRIAMIWGAIASAAGMGLMALAVHKHALCVFLAATATAGVGYSLLFVGGLKVVNRTAPAQHRGGLLSALYLFAYVSLGAVALLLGQVATSRGLGSALDMGAAGIALMSAVTIALVASMPALPPTTTTGS